MKWLGLSKPLPDRHFRASYDQVVGPNSMRVGTTALFEVTVSNRSESVWLTAGHGSNEIHLSYHWYDKAGKLVIWDGRRLRIPLFLRPMRPVPIRLLVVAPDRPGEYTLTIDLVQEHVSWFSLKGCDPAEVRIRVTQ